MKGIFITGTSTDVGKTYIGTQIARELQHHKLSVVPRKPVESGCLAENNQLIPRDALALKNAAGYQGSLDEVCPYRFEPAISPVRAARLANLALSIEQVRRACTAGFNPDTDFLLVEGAGGFYSPLCTDGLNADLAQALNLPIVLIAKDRLGCINDILLTVEAIGARGLDLSCIILNQPETPESSPHMDNEAELKDMLDYPLFHLPFLPQNTSKKSIQNIVDFILKRV
ncbi:MAG: dethiobiotin synthase [Gammaproteobacteria bacterium]|nr:dethiobiotin synthase [Gammaproteobacteria bacterium]